MARGIGGRTVRRGRGEWDGTDHTKRESESLARPPDDRYRFLTDRQMQILRLTCEGHTNLEIARIVGISDQTVKNHKTGAYRILGVHSIGPACVILAHSGVMPLDRIYALHSWDV